MRRRGPRATAGFEQRRAQRRAGLGPDGAERSGIAQVAARLIADHGIADWSLAKRKAARELDLPERAALPGDDEIEAALLEHQAIFGGEEHVARLREQREEALLWMRRLDEFSPRLVGGVAGGWATDYSDIRLELVADDAKAVEIFLLNHDVEYRALPPRTRDAPEELSLDTPRGGLRLIVRTPHAARQLPRRDRNGAPATRLDAADLAALLAGK
jgi:hypothetical protein